MADRSPGSIRVTAVFRATILFFILTLCWSGSVFINESSAEAQVWKKTVDRKLIRQRIREAIAVQDRHTEKWLRLADVIGTGTALGPDGRPTISVFSRRTRLQDIPREVDGIAVNIKYTEIFIAYNDPRDWYERPVPIGISSGHPEVTAGTIGARVMDAGGKVYALSNNHVYANQNDARRGDSILQPGRIDGGSDPLDKIGELQRYARIDFSSNGLNRLDAAIASTTTDELGRSTLPEGYGMPSTSIFGDRNADGYLDDREDLLGLPVQKFGRTTGLTHGRITEVNVTISVCYADCFDPDSSKVARFVDQIRIVGNDNQDFSAGGDSGSLIITDNPQKKPVALLFAGSTTSTLANRIDLVLNRFSIGIDGALPEEICGGDFDGDGDVDGYDISEFMQYFQTDMAADINDDDLLNQEDSGRLTEEFGRYDCP
jgi:hypothetical protein